MAYSFPQFVLLCSHRQIGWPQSNAIHGLNNIIAEGRLSEHMVSPQQFSKFRLGFDEAAVDQLILFPVID